MEFSLLVASEARRDYVLKQLEKLGKQIERITQVSWIFSKKFIIVINVRDLVEARSICELVGCDFDTLKLNFSEC